MNRFKFNAYLAEFPALSSLLLDRNEKLREAGYCNEIKVARVSRELLNYVPTYNSWDGSMVSISSKETFSFLLKGGSIINDAVRQAGKHGSNYAHSQTFCEQGETVLEAIDRHCCSGCLALIFAVSTGFTIHEHCSTPHYSVTIYKPSKGESIAQTIAEAVSAALTEVRAEANF